MNTNGTLALALVAGSLLAGCGGDSDMDTEAPPSAISTLEGAYQGMVSDGSEHLTLVLENGAYYSLYGETTSNFVTYGLVQGSGNASDGSFSSTDLKDFHKADASIAASLTGSFTPSVSFNGTVTEGAASFTFTGAPVAASLYNYKTAANVADIVGSWYMIDMQDERYQLNIESSGAITGSSSNGCSVTGTLVPRPSGKNVFNVSLTFGAAPCNSPGLAASGIGITLAMAHGIHELVIAGTDSTRTNATALSGAR